MTEKDWGLCPWCGSSLRLWARADGTAPLLRCWWWEGRDDGGHCWRSYKLTPTQLDAYYATQPQARPASYQAALL